MAAPAADPKEPKLRTVLAPLPATRRGYGIVLNASPKADKIIYTNGRVVVVRSLANPSESVLFSEHKAAVSAAVFSPNGNWVASGDVEGNVIIWSYPQLKVKNTFQIAKTINDLDWDADGTRIVAAGDGAQKARVFSWDSGNNLGEITMHSHPVISCSYRKVRPFRVATGSEDLSVNMYEGPPFKYSQSFKGHSRYPNGVRYSPDGSKFASVGADSKVVLYDGSTGAVLKEAGADAPGAHKGAIYAVSWSPDSKSLLTASADKTAKIWNAETLAVEKTFSCFGNDTLDQQVGALWAGEFLVTVSLSGAINYLDVSAPEKVKRVLHGHQASVQSVAIDSKQGTFFTAGITGEIARWDFASGDAQWMTGKGHGGKVVSGLALNADGSTLWSVGLDDKVRAHKTSGLVLSDEAGDLGGLPVSAAASPKDSSLLAVVLAQEKLVLVRQATVVSTLALGFTPTTVTWTPDASSVVVGGKDKKIHVYDLGKDSFKAQDKTLDTHDKPLTSLRFSPDGTALASTDMEASVYIHVWDSRALQNKSGWRFHQAAVKDVDWSPSGARLATSSQDTHLIVWRDLKAFNGSERSRAKDAHTDGALFVRWWDENTLLSVGGDRAIKIWTVAE